MRLPAGGATFRAAMLALLASVVIPQFNLFAYEQPRVVHEADRYLSMEPRTIVTVVNPRSAGGPHDWSSEGDYWWPNPKDPNGPYIQRDGMTNPDNFVAHRQLMLRFVRAFGALAAAYKLTGDEKYAQAAVRQIDAWFVDPATRMNPNLQYAQAIHGITTGRSIGVIDTVHFAEVALGIEALRGSRALSPREDAAVTEWFRQYLHWLTTSRNGIEESHAANNHGTCWVLQAAAYADLTGNEAVLQECRQRFEHDLLPHQMAPLKGPKLKGPFGSFPRELNRTKPYGYSIFNLDVMTALAQLLSTPGHNLIAYTLPDGRSLVRGIEFLAPYLANKTHWIRRPDVMYWRNWPVRQPFLIFGALATGRQDWKTMWTWFDPEPQVEEIRRNYPIRQPVLWVRFPEAGSDLAAVRETAPG